MRRIDKHTERRLMRGAFVLAAVPAMALGSVAGILLSRYPWAREGIVLGAVLAVVLVALIAKTVVLREANGPALSAANGARAERAPWRDR